MRQVSGRRFRLRRVRVDGSKHWDEPCLGQPTSPNAPGLIDVRLRTHAYILVAQQVKRDKLDSPTKSCVMAHYHDLSFY